MKKIILSFFSIILLLILNGCSDNAGTNSSTSGFGGLTGGGTANVTFTIGHTQGNQGGTLFTAKPSANVTVTEFSINLPAQNLSDKYQGDGTTVFQGGTVYALEEYNGVATGQKWTFNFKGKLESSTGQDYEVNSDYTIP